jgi:hypothetical protein
MSRLPLAQVTLCAVDTRTPALAAQALLRSMQQVQFGRVLLFTARWLPTRVLPGVELFEIDPVDTEAELSAFIRLQLPAHVRTSHLLLQRWDAGVVEPAAWSDEFLVHDYVAPLWPHAVHGHRVGAAGLSLRSRRFMAAGLDPRLPAGAPEDHLLCGTYREFLEQVHGVSFAPERLARRFAEHDDAVLGQTFGVLGVQHLPRLLPEPELIECLHRLPAEFFRCIEAPRLARALALRGMPDATRELLRRHQQLGLGGVDAPLLAATSSVMGLLST